MQFAHVLNGRCHCGAVGVTYRTDVAPEDTAVLACQCSFCRKHGSRAVADSRGQVRFIEHSPGALLPYRFGLRTADYLLCRHCGVYVGAVVPEPGGGYALVNASVLDESERFVQSVRVVRYDDETLAMRLERRRRRWTPLASD